MLHLRLYKTSMKYNLILSFLLLMGNSFVVSAQVTLADSLIVQTNAVTGYEAVVKSSEPTNVDTSGTNFICAMWTSSGINNPWRGYMKFDLSSIPANATIQSASLSLFADSTSGYGYTGTPTFGIDNASKLLRVTSPWAKDSISWSKQPTYTNTNAASLPQSSSTDQDYLNIDITNIVQDWMANGNYGLMLKHDRELTPYNSMIFHGSRSANAAKTPIFKVYYTFPNSIDDVTNNINVRLYPNPNKGLFMISGETQSRKNISISIINSLGQVVYANQTTPTGKDFRQNIDLGGVPSGIYYIRLSNETGTMVSRIEIDK